ncbi:hypothetical protein VK792_13035 [Mesobacterium sp. TK19101]|uniref:Uncharacterized protein n=1 Tax=Mesobacterium hydrothermale TaxID=3111907 RepID=A0ABU6HJC1_9RHOB|nr:hypothetical protein [Mesobacterium sp. TK19101]MEC3862212.1 hypothetical protein [Mesobacterium sp. TK19101]
MAAALSHGGDHRRRKAVEQMQVMIPETEEVFLKEQFERAVKAVVFLSEELEALKTKVDAGEATEAEGKKALTSLNFWMRQAHEMEMALARIRREEAGIAGGYGCDLEQARIEIGCRLDRLRECCGAGEVPE